MRDIARIGGALAAVAILLAPAIWNRFPLLQYDTGGYLARWFEGYLVPSRSTVYGLFLTAFAHPDFWLVVIVQAALTVWVLALVLRALGFGGRPIPLLAVTALLSVFTTLPWLASVLLTDIFAGLAVLALHVLVFADAALRRWERAALVGLIAFAVATHSATFATLLAILAVAATARCFFPIGAIGGITRGIAALTLGALMLLGANFITSGRIAWTPGGIALSFGRMLQDGIVAQYLKEHCPNPRLRLCSHQHELPTDADVFFWGESVFDRLGRFRGLGDEMGTIVFESLRAYPAWQAKAAIAATARQLVRVGTGEGVVDSAWHSQGMIERHTPSANAGMRAARQQRGELDFTAINRIHKPIALASMLLLLPIMAWGYRHKPFADLSQFAATTALAFLTNAVVCGVLANTHDRYGARLVWLAPLLVLIAGWRLCEQARSAAPAPADGRRA